MCYNSGMSGYLDTVFLPPLYLNRDKQAIEFIEGLLLRQASCASVSMYGNGKDYLFYNVVKRLEAKKLPHRLMVLNTISSDELRDFADMLVSDTKPTMCLVNLRIGKDTSWFVETINELRIKRGYNFVSYVNSYVGDIYKALQEFNSSVMQPLIILERISYVDSLPMIKELADRFGFYPSEEQKRDIYKWSYGHVGLIRTLFLLKSQSPNKKFTPAELLTEPTVLERLCRIVGELGQDKIKAIKSGQLGLVERVFLKKFGYINSEGGLFHPLIESFIFQKTPQPLLAFSLTEVRVLEYLRMHEDSVVSRDDIARIVWGEEECEDKYSDWAIGQLIYRLRKKLEFSAAHETIITRKGQGFIYARLGIALEF